MTTGRESSGRADTGSTSLDWLLDRFSTAPEHIAFIHQRRRVSYGALLADVGHFQARLQETGVRPGECVAVCGDHSPELFSLLLALAKNRNILIPLGPGTPGHAPWHDERREDRHEDRHQDRHQELLRIPGCDWMIDLEQESRAWAIKPRKVARGNSLLEAFVKTGAPGIVLFSSGSTGKPKAILHDFSRVASKFRKQRNAVVAICFLMIDHFGGINTLLSISASLGTVVTLADRSVNTVCEAIAEHGVQLLPATPSFLNMMMLSQAERTYDLSSLERITYGTEVMSKTTLDRVRTAFPGVELQQTYGLTEVGVLRTQSRPDGSLWVRIGGEGFATTVRDGILWIKSDYAMVGYLNATAPTDAEGWFNTGDEVEVDGEYVRFLGRRCEIINVGGQKAYPAEIEDVILSLDNVRDVTVAGEPHPLLGQIVVARMQLWQDEPVDLLKKRVRGACLARLASYKAPAKVLIADGPLYNARQKKQRAVR